nr:endonuclease/exonuclease/phosphatase family protein [Akkermansiaceae bacterium]
QPAELSRLTGWHVVFGAAIPLQGGEYGQAILSRTALENPQIHRLPGPGEPRIALAATTTTGLGTITVVTVHLDFGTAQTAQAEALAKVLEKNSHPVILGGDFNAAPDSAAMAPFAKAPWTLVPKSPPAATHPADAPRIEIDHFVLRGVRAARPATVLDEPVASDHRPVLVSVTAAR